MCDYCHNKAADDFIARFRPGSEAARENPSYRDIAVSSDDANRRRTARDIALPEPDETPGGHRQ